MGEISNRIDEIIRIRNSRIKDLDEIRSNVEKVHVNILEFGRLQNELQQELNDNSVDMELVSVDGFEKKYREYITAIDSLKKRLSRDRLHISFVGRAGMGKSLVMQKISGLDDSVIPSGDGSDCTGAKSIITNSENDGVEANITFFSRSELVAIVNEYLRAISDKALLIASADDIPKINIHALEEMLNNETDYDRKANLLKRLTKYKENFNEYINNLGGNITVPKDDIIKYVAQHDNSESYYKYLGVKLADIHTKFPVNEVGKIVLVDTVGIDDTALGIEEDQLNTVKNDSDAIILMFKPDTRGGMRSNEQNIISSIQTAMTPEYTQEMLFWVVNRDNREGGNAAAVDKTICDIKERKCKIADILDVDCFSDNEVENKLLIPVLRKISQRISYADNVLIKKLNELGNQLYYQYHNICKDMDRAISKSTSADIKRSFETTIHDTWERDLSGKLRWLYKDKYLPIREKPCLELQNAANEKIKNIRKWIPSKEDILGLLIRGKKDQDKVYIYCTEQLRMKIIDDFFEIDTVLEKIIENMKKEVLHIFTDEDNGKLGYIIPFNCSSDEWIEEFLDKVKADDNHYLSIAKALRKFRKYTINVQGFLIHYVRDCLDCIDNTLSDIPRISPIGGKAVNYDQVSEEILAILKQRAERVLDDISIMLDDLYKVPNKSMFAAIKDLYDRITFSINEQGEEVDKEWEHLYKDWIPLIWKERYEQKSAEQRSTEHKNEVLSSLKEMDNLNIFTVKEIV